MVLVHHHRQQQHWQYRRQGQVQGWRGCCCRLRRWTFGHTCSDQQAEQAMEKMFRSSNMCAVVCLLRPNACTPRMGTK